MHHTFYDARPLTDRWDSHPEDNLVQRMQRLFNTSILYDFSTGLTIRGGCALAGEEYLESTFVAIRTEHAQREDRAITHHQRWMRRLNDYRDLMRRNINKGNSPYPMRSPVDLRMRSAAGKHVAHMLSRRSTSLTATSIDHAMCAVWDAIQLPLYASFAYQSYLSAGVLNHPRVEEAVSRVADTTGQHYTDLATMLTTIPHTRNADRGWKSAPKMWGDMLNTLDMCAANPLHLLHNIHVSETDDAMLAYTPSVEYYLRGRQVKVKPGKYLAKFYGHVLSDEQIKTLAERWHSAETLTVKFVENTDPAGWVRVYEHGPDSCMSGSAADCVEVYARRGNSLRLAYAEDVDGTIVARAIVREDRKQYVRVYPNCTSSATTITHNKFKALLESEPYGYTHGNLLGIHLHAIEHSHGHGRYVMPYIDSGNGGNRYVELVDGGTTGEYFVVNADREGTYADNTCGYIEVNPGMPCDSCGERFDQDDLTYIEAEEQRVCDHCRDEHYVYAHGRRYEDWFSRDDCVYCESDSEWYHIDAASYHDVYQCAHSGDWYHGDDLISCDVGRYEGELINADLAKHDELTEEWGHESDFTDDEAGVTTFDDYLKSDFITGDDYHEQSMFAIKVGRTTLYVHPDNLDAENLAEHFVLCGSGAHWALYPKGYFGYDITPANCAWFYRVTALVRLVNVTEPEHGSYDTVDDLLEAIHDEYTDDDDPAQPYVPVAPVSAPAPVMAA